MAMIKKVSQNFVCRESMEGENTLQRLREKHLVAMTAETK